MDGGTIQVFTIQEERKRKYQLQGLWFDLTHSWRTKASKGVPLVPDLSQFMIVEAIATIGLLIVGLIAPMNLVEGQLKLLPVVIVLVTLTVNVLTSWERRYLVADSITAASFIVSLIVLGQLGYKGTFRTLLVWSVNCGGIIGMLICNQIRYKRSRFEASKYGQFSSLWVRKLAPRRFEFVMVDDKRQVVWRRYARSTSWLLDPVLGASLSIDMNNRIINFPLIQPDPADPHRPRWKPGGGQPGGEDLDLRWVTVYPDLAATRMEGLRRRNPVNWQEAFVWTPGLMDAMADRFFSDTPSPAAPPGYEELDSRPELTVAEKAPW